MPLIEAQTGRFLVSVAQWNKSNSLLKNWPLVRIQPETPGELAQLVERLLCKQDVSGSSPIFST